MVIGLGTAAHSAVWDYLNEKGIPDLWTMTGAHKWAADPKGHPWTVGILPDYFVEGHHLRQVHFGEPAGQEGGHPLPER